jgi:hemerythrin-like domain-containing protein
MSVFDSLSKEHALLLKLVGRLERAAGERDERLAAREIRNILLVLFKALKAHEELENLVFAESPEAPSPSAYKALASIESQHRALNELQKEAETILNTLTPEGGSTIRELSLRLASLLRRHFDEEERTLWPSFNAYAGRSMLHRLARQAREQFRTMERDVDRYWAEVETYMTGDR